MRRREFLKAVGAVVLAPSMPAPRPKETMEIAFDCATGQDTLCVGVFMYVDGELYRHDGEEWIKTSWETIKDSEQQRST